MHYITTANFIFKGKKGLLESIATYCENKQIGEAFLDDEDNSLILDIEEGALENGKESVLNLVRTFRRKFSAANIFVLGTISSSDGDEAKEYECHCKNGDIKYRETEWDYSAEIDEDFSYEEFEDETGTYMDEDEYNERVHRAREGILYDAEDKYGDWEYID